MFLFWIAIVYVLFATNDLMFGLYIILCFIFLFFFIKTIQMSNNRIKASNENITKVKLFDESIRNLIL